MDQSQNKITPEEQTLIQEGLAREHARARAISHNRPSPQPNELVFEDLDEQEADARMKRHAVSNADVYKGVFFLVLGSALIAGALYYTAYKDGSRLQSLGDS